MNPDLARLQPYPFEKLRRLFASVSPNAALAPISLSIGEPKHPTPDFIKQALTQGLDGLANYPTTQGSAALRQGIAAWATRRYGLQHLHADTQILPVNGSREALFSFAQTVVDRTQPGAVVVSPNPFYQIYEGAALLAGATPAFINALPENQSALDLEQLPTEIWQRTQLMYVCSPDNPTGRVMTLDQWRELFYFSDRYGFVIASDECYSEIYFDENQPTLGALQAAEMLGRSDYRRLVVFSSLSKRSNVPGMRSGFAAGDADILRKYLLYRTYHGSAMGGAVAAASLAAWNDEAHVVENRRQYREKFAAVTPMLSEVMDVELPDASFYLWAKTPIADIDFAQQLYRDYNVAVLPGSLLAREVRGVNPGSHYIRIALVAPLDECLEGARRITQFIHSL